MNVFRRLWYLLRRSRVDADLREEIETHRSLRQARLEHDGIAGPDAELTSRRVLGNTMLSREDAREVWGWPAFEHFWQDARYAFRALRRRPAIVAVAVSTLALAFGANLAVFSLIDRVLLRPLDVRDPSALVTVELDGGSRTSPTPRTSVYWVPASRILEWPVFDGVAAVSAPIERSATEMVLSGANRPDQMIRGAFVTSNYFQVLGIRPSIGRDFRFDDDTVRAAATTIVSHRLWLSRFGGDESIIGQTVGINGTPVIVVGVASRVATGVTFGAEPPDVYLPLRTAPRVATDTGTQSDGRGGFRTAPAAVASPGAPTRDFELSPVSPIASVVVVGRLKPGEASQAAEWLVSLMPSARPRFVPLANTMLPFGSEGDLRSFLWLLGGTVVLTLLVGCAGFTGLLLASIDQRHSELAIRAALGSGLGRIVREAVLQAFGLVAGGFISAVLVAKWLEQGFTAFVLPGNIAVSSLRPAFDARFFIFGIALAVVVGAVVAGATAWRVSRRQLSLGLKNDPRAVPRLGVARALVTVQVGTCLVFAFAAVLFAKSTANGLKTDVGFNRSNLIAVSVSVPRGRMFDSSSSLPLLERVRTAPGVAAATIGPLPLVRPSDQVQREVAIDGTIVELSEPVDVVYAGPGYFTTLGQTLGVGGRDFDARDAINAPRVAILNDAATARWWPAGRPIGRVVGFPLPPAMRGRVPPREFSVIGVVGDVKLRSLRDADRPVIYLPLAQHEFYIAGMASAAGSWNFLVRGAESGDRVAESVRLAIAAAGWTPGKITRLDRAVDDLLMPQRFGRMLLSLLGAIALALTMLGVYGLVSVVVGRSLREIGIRRALGASSASVAGGVLRSAMLPVAAGVVLGAAGALVVGRFAERFMYGISGQDPTSLIVAVGVIGLASAAAVFVPLRRAARIDPVEILRAE